MSSRGYYDMVRQSQNPQPEPAPTSKQCAHDYWVETHRDYISNQSVTRHFQCKQCSEVRTVALTTAQAAGLPAISPVATPNAQGCFDSGIQLNVDAIAPKWGPTMGWRIHEERAARQRLQESMERQREM